MLSVPHIIVIFVVVLVIFGPQKLPELARGLGKLLAEFRKASTDFRSAFEDEMRDLERQAREVELHKQQLTATVVTEPATLPPAAEANTIEPPPQSSTSAEAETIPRGAKPASSEEAQSPSTENNLHDHQQPA